MSIYSAIIDFYCIAVFFIYAYFVEPFVIEPLLERKK